MITYTIGGAGGYDLQIDGLTDTEYESTITKLLAQLEGLTVGQKLVTAIKSQCAGKKLVIQKRNPSGTSLLQVCNAGAYISKDFDTRGDYDLLELAKAKERQKSVAKGRSLTGYTPEEDKKSPVYDRSALGSGGGTDATVRFTPGVWAETTGQCRQPGSKFQGPGSAPDAVLFHELVHAYRIMTGSQLKTMLTVDGHANQPHEEFVAILIGNVFLSDQVKGRDLRSFDHGAYGVLKAPSEFLTRNNNDALVRTFCQDLVVKPLLTDLSFVQCDFNPIRDVLHPKGN
jgi:hypothetical protein